MTPTCGTGAGHASARPRTSSALPTVVLQKLDRSPSPMFAAEIRRQRVSRLRAGPEWRWHLDEMFVKINGERHILWRAIDHEGEVLESFVTKTRDKKAALKFLRKLMKRYGSPEGFVTDLLRSYSAAMREVGVVEKHITGKHLNNRAENSHLPFRRRERAMLRFRRMRSLQKFVSVHASVTNHFNLDRSLSRRSISSRTGPPLSPSGVSSAQPEAGARRQL